MIAENVRTGPRCPVDLAHRAEWEMGSQTVYCHDCEDSHPPYERRDCLDPDPRTTTEVPLLMNGFCPRCGKPTQFHPQDKTDPRLDYERRTIPIDDDALASEVAAAHLARIDAADRAAGIVRVDTNDETLVERLAVVIWDTHAEGVPLNHYDESLLGVLQAEARAVLAALREAT